MSLNTKLQEMIASGELVLQSEVNDLDAAYNANMACSNHLLTNLGYYANTATSITHQLKTVTSSINGLATTPADNSYTGHDQSCFVYHPPKKLLNVFVGETNDTTTITD